MVSPRICTNNSPCTCATSTLAQLTRSQSCFQQTRLHCNRRRAVHAHNCQTRPSADPAQSAPNLGICQPQPRQSRTEVMIRLHAVPRSTAIEARTTQIYVCATLDRCYTPACAITPRTPCKPSQKTAKYHRYCAPTTWFMPCNGDQVAHLN